MVTRNKYSKILSKRPEVIEICKMMLDKTPIGDLQKQVALPLNIN
jgi:hypothetical protein